MSKENYEKFLPSKNYKQPDKEQWIKNWEFIDSIDWPRYIPINEEITVYNLIKDLEKNVIIPEEQCGFILNWIGEDEFAMFIKNKYGYDYREEEKDNIFFYEADYYILRKE